MKRRDNGYLTYRESLSRLSTKKKLLQLNPNETKLSCNTNISIEEISEIERDSKFVISYMDSNNVGYPSEKEMAINFLRYIEYVKRINAA